MKTTHYSSFGLPPRAGLKRMMIGCLCLLTAVLISLSSGAAAQRLSKEEAARNIAETYGVEVLRVSERELGEGNLAYEVVVMNPGGAYNEAFMVTRLLVDPETGDLIPEFRHRSSGYNLSNSPSFRPDRVGGDGTMRRESFR